MPRRQPDQKTAVTVVFVLAVFMVIIDTSIVNVALPVIGRNLGAGPATVGAVSVGYLVSLAVTVPASGWAGDRFGGRRVLLGATPRQNGAGHRPSSPSRPPSRPLPR
jgi:MFS family permease